MRHTFTEYVQTQGIKCTAVVFDHMIFHPPVTLPTPTVSARDNTVWTLTSPDGSRAERYIAEFECSVRNITFVEKYISVSASGGTGRVATNASCFGGLGQLYRVKVWAVSGPSISRALVCIPDGQCREEGGKHTMTFSVSDYCSICGDCQHIYIVWYVPSALVCVNTVQIILRMTCIH